MNSVILKYLLNSYLKTLLKVFLFFYSFGIIINLFEEIEFFKNLDVSILTPLLLTIIYYDINIMTLTVFCFLFSRKKKLRSARITETSTRY